MLHCHNIGGRKLVDKIDEEVNEKLSETNIEKRLDTIISILLSPDIVESNQLKKIEYLTKMSFTNDEIAQILTTTKGTVESQKYKKPRVKK